MKGMRMAYADDLTIITGRVKHNQQVLDAIAGWLQWTKTMKAKPAKCRSLAAKFFISGAERLKWEPHSKRAYSTFDPSS